MGATPHPGGVTFRVWAPHARQVSVIGSFNAWDGGAHPMEAEERGCWSIDVADARVGDEYRFRLVTEHGDLTRIDPYAREVTSSVGNAIVPDPHFDWAGDDFRLAPWNELVLYELHVGTFNIRDDATPPGTLGAAAARLGHLQRLGVNAIEIMPIAGFAGERSWGYNPSHIFAVERDYGGPAALKRFVRQAHQQGIAVLLDVVYNHFGPGDLDLWQFDGWSEHGRGGIWFYNDDRAMTPWGETRPDYGRGEVRQYILDNVLMWLEEYHLDGLRFDSTQYIRSVDGFGAHPLPDGWTLLQWINTRVRERCPGRLTIAEDLLNDSLLTREVTAGGAGFGAQWDPDFVHPVRRAVTALDDQHRSLAAVRDAILHRHNDDAFNRVIYSESHDEVANSRARVPQEVHPAEPGGWYARKRSTLAAALVLTAPGIPMLFQGQEFLTGGSFGDTVPVDWDQREEFHGIVRLYRDLIRLRRNRDGFTRGLSGQYTRVHHLDEERKILAWHRWDRGGPGDDVVVVANLRTEAREGQVIGFPAAGVWRLRLNSDWRGYSDDFGDHPGTDVVAEPGERDGQPFHAAVSIGPYSVLVYSR